MTDLRKTAQGPEGNGYDLPCCRACGEPGTDEHTECRACNPLPEDRAGLVERLRGSASGLTLNVSNLEADEDEELGLAQEVMAEAADALTADAKRIRELEAERDEARTLLQLRTDESARFNKAYLRAFERGIALTAERDGALRREKSLLDKSAEVRRLLCERNSLTRAGIAERTRAERAEARVARLEEALGPFAEAFNMAKAAFVRPTTLGNIKAIADYNLSVASYRAAVLLLAPTDAGGAGDA